VGFLSSSSTVVRFAADPPPTLDRDAVARAVSRRAFRELDLDGGDSPKSVGWVAIHDPLATELTATDLFFHQYLVVGFRYDRRAVPAKLLWLERRRAEEKLRAELDRPRLGRAARQQIRAEVEARLLVRALPVPRLFDCVWNLQNGKLYFSGRLRAATEAFSEHFRETFGVTPVPLIPYLNVEHVGLGAGIVDRVRGADPSSLVAEAAPADRDDVPHLPLAEAGA